MPGIRGSTRLTSLRFERSFDAVGNHPRQGSVPRRREVNVTRPLIDLQFLLGRPIQIVDRNPVFFHDAGGCLVERHFFARHAAGRSVGDGRGAGPDEFGFGLFQTRNQLTQVFFVLRERRHLFALGRPDVAPLAIEIFQVVQAEIEMNDVPLSFTQPLIEMREPMSRIAAIGRRAMDVGLAAQQLAHGERVANRNRVAQDQDSRQRRIVLDRQKRRVEQPHRLAGRRLRFFGRVGSPRQIRPPAPAGSADNATGKQRMKRTPNQSMCSQRSLRGNGTCKRAPTVQIVQAGNDPGEFAQDVNPTERAASATPDWLRPGVKRPLANTATTIEAIQEFSSLAERKSWGGANRPTKRHNLLVGQDVIIGRSRCGAAAADGSPGSRYASSAFHAERTRKSDAWPHAIAENHAHAPMPMRWHAAVVCRHSAACRRRPAACCQCTAWADEPPPALKPARGASRNGAGRSSPAVLHCHADEGQAGPRALHVARRAQRRALAGAARLGSRTACSPQTGRRKCSSDA